MNIIMPMEMFIMEIFKMVLNMDGAGMSLLQASSMTESGVTV